MNNKLISSTYGYLVCLGCLALFAYALLTLAPPATQVRAKLRPIEVSVINTDTTNTDTTGTASQSSDAAALAAFDCTVAPERFRSALQGLRASQKSFDDARTELEIQRGALAEGSIRIRLIQRGLIMLFAAVVFVFHWRSLQRLNGEAA